MHALAITNTLSKKAKAAYTTFNRMMELADRGLREREVLIAWNTIKHPEYIWTRVMVAHLQWIDRQDPEGRDFLHLMALLWQYGVRDTTGILPAETEATLARLAFLLRVHEDMAYEFEDITIGPAELGWVLTCYFKDKGLEAPLPEGRSSWESYIVGTIVAARLCERGNVVANAKRVQDYLNATCLPPSVFDIDDMRLMGWLAIAEQESARVLAQV